MTQTQATQELDAEVLMRCREFEAAGRTLITGTVLGRRFPQVSQSRLYSALDRLEGAGLIARRRINDGRPTKKREYVLTSKGRGE